MSRFGRIAVIGMAMLAASCSPKMKENLRVRSPDGSVDAVIAERLTDATVATPTEIYIAGRDVTPTATGLLFRADQVDGLEVTWSGGDSLMVSAAAARTFVEKESVTVSVAGTPRRFKVSYQIRNRPE